MKFENAKQLDEGFDEVAFLRKSIADQQELAKTSPQSFIDEEFLALLEEKRVENRERRLFNKHTHRAFALVPAMVYHLDPEFWSNELNNTKSFKQKYPYFCV